MKESEILYNKMSLMQIYNRVKDEFLFVEEFGDNICIGCRWVVIWRVVKFLFENESRGRVSTLHVGASGTAKYDMCYFGVIKYYHSLAVVRPNSVTRLSLIFFFFCDPYVSEKKKAIFQPKLIINIVLSAYKYNATKFVKFL